MQGRIDWTKIINDIRYSDKGVSLADIAKIIGISKSSLVRMRIFGFEPRYYIGESLISLWRSSTKRDDQPPPRCRKE